MAWKALILAGQRTQNDPVAAAAKVATKALAPVGGRAMLRRVYDVLSQLDVFSEILIVGDVDLLKRHKDLENLTEPNWLQNHTSISLSVLAGLNKLGLECPILVVTADHALLQAAWVRQFLEDAQKNNADVSVALTDFSASSEPPPGPRRTSYNFSDGAYGGCNLFAFMTPEAKKAVLFWQKMEKNRKKPWRMLATVDVFSVIQYATGYLSLPKAMTRLSKKLGCQIASVLLPTSLAAMDVDKPDDWYTAQKLAAKAD